MKIFGHEWNFISAMDIFQEGKKFFNRVSGNTGTSSVPSPTSEVRSEGPSTFRAEFTDEDEVAILSFLRFIGIDEFFFIRDLVKEMQARDDADAKRIVEGKAIGIKGQRRNSFLVRLVQLQQKIVEDIREEPAKGRKQGQAKDQRGNAGPETERGIKKIVRNDPRLTPSDARALSIKWWYSLYKRYASLGESDAYVHNADAITKVIDDLEALGLITTEPLSKKAKDALTQFLKWFKSEGREWLESFDDDAIRLAYLIADGNGKGYDEARATLKACGRTDSEITAELKQRIRARLPATPAEAKARVSEARKNAVSTNRKWINRALIGIVILMTIALVAPI